MEQSRPLRLIKSQSITAYGICAFLALLSSLGTDFLSPLAPFTQILFVVSLAAAACSFAIFRFVPGFRTPRMREVFNFTCIVAGTFLLFIAGQAVTPADRAGQSRGIFATASAAVASVQTTVLPLGDDTRVLFHLEDELRSGNMAGRIAAIRAGLNLEDKDERRIALQLALTLGDAQSRQTAILAVLAMRLNTYVPIATIPSDKDIGLQRALMGANLRFTRVDTDSGNISGYLITGSVEQYANGTVALSRILITSTVRPEGSGPWESATLTLAPNENATLKGTLQTTGGKQVAIEIPLL
jgi:hypothetical protein